MTRSNHEIESEFSKIYHNHSWGGGSLSGPGSDLRLVRPYLGVLRRFLADPKLDIKTIVDIGCGDWAFSRTIDWGDRHYTGIDIVPGVVENLQKTYGSSNRVFVRMNFLEMDPPPADLVIIKDVLQHLSNESILHFLSRTLGRYRYALVTNDYRRYILSFGGRLIPKIEIRSARNVDVADSGYRPIALSAPPFSMSADRVLSYGNCWYSKQAINYYVKETLLWRNQGADHG